MKTVADSELDAVAGHWRERSSVRSPSRAPVRPCTKMPTEKLASSSRWCSQIRWSTPGRLPMSSNSVFTCAEPSTKLPTSVVEFTSSYDLRPTRILRTTTLPIPPPNDHRHLADAIAGTSRTPCRDRCWSRSTSSHRPPSGNVKCLLRAVPRGHALHCVALSARSRRAGVAGAHPVRLTRCGTTNVRPHRRVGQEPAFQLEPTCRPSKQRSRSRAHV